VAERFASLCFNEGVAGMELLQPDAKDHFESALELLPFVSHGYREEHEENLSQMLSIATDLAAKEGAAHSLDLIAGNDADADHHGDGEEGGRAADSSMMMEED
jgi:hypothetical protein